MQISPRQEIEDEIRSLKSQIDDLECEDVLDMSDDEYDDWWDLKSELEGDLTDAENDLEAYDEEHPDEARAAHEWKRQKAQLRSVYGVTYPASIADYWNRATGLYRKDIS